MSRSEWRSVLLLAVAVVVITTAPYLLAWSKQGSDWHFSGFLFGVEDGNSYIGKMRLGARGVWDFYLFYTPEASDGVPLVFLPYIIPGQIVGHFIADTDPALTPALIVTFHLMRIVFDALLVVAIYRFVAVFLDDPRDRLIAAILALLGGGLGWLLSLSGQSALPADFYIPEGFSFLILFGLPHLALARAALLGGLLALMKSLPLTPAELRSAYPSPTQMGRGEKEIVGARHAVPTQPVNVGERARHVVPLRHRVHIARSEWRWLILAGVCWLVVGLSVPFYFVIIYCVLGAWGLAAWVKQRRFPLALFARCVVAGGITLPLFLFYTIAFTVNPVFAAWSAQNLLASPPPLQYLLAYLPLGLLALFGARRVWRLEGIRPALLIGWVLIVPILVYLPLNVQRRMSEAVIVPLAILAAAGLRVLAERGVPGIVRGALVTVTLLTSAFLLLGGFLAAANPARPLFRPAAEIDALNWLNENSAPDDIVLSAVETGNVIPAWTHLRTFMGHGPETINWQFKTARLEYFYSGGMSGAERASLYASPCALTFACAGTIRYVMDGPLEQALAPGGDPAWASGLTQVYDANGYRIYAMP